MEIWKNHRETAIPVKIYCQGSLENNDQDLQTENGKIWENSIFSDTISIFNALSWRSIFLRFLPTTGGIVVFVVEDGQ